MFGVENIIFNRIGISETSGLNPLATALLVGKSISYVNKNHTVFEGEHFPKDGPAILVGNHYQEADNYKVTYACSTYAGRIVRAVVRRSLVDRHSKESAEYLASIGEKAEPLKYNPLNAFVLRGVGTIPVSRGETDISVIRGTRRILAAGWILGIYLQPTRNEKCLLASLEKGAGYIATRHPDVPVYPCAFSGPPDGPEKMTIVEPFTVSQMEEELRGELSAAEVTIMIADMVASALPERVQEDWRNRRESEFARLNPEKKSPSKM